MIGGFELIIVLGVCALMAAGIAAFIWTVLQLLKRSHTPSDKMASTTVKLASCPRCGTPLSPDAPQGLCPRCVLQVGIGTQGTAGPAFKDESGKPNAPDPAELAGHFPQLEILELLGQGGMGAVYKARQKDLDRLVALKVLPGGGAHDPAFAERFMREARALARLNHPSIVAVHDFGQVQRSQADLAAPGTQGSQGQKGEAGATPALLYYFIMEYIDGPNLRQVMQAKKLSPREAMSIVPKICEALQFAHDEGIVHRDIKPENILVDRKGRVKIADFGIAKIVGKTRDATLTGAKDVIGTPHYMAPEQVEKPTEVDHRADIYSLGVVFYEMLTGELPLGKFEVPSRKVQVDVRLDEVVLHTLEKEPDRRYQHASEVKTDVETISSHPQTQAPSSAATLPQPADPNRRRWQPIAAALLLVACVLLWGLMGFVTYVMPMIVERYASQEMEAPVMTRLIFQFGSFAHHLGILLVPVLVLATAGSLVWVFLSSMQPQRPTSPSSPDAPEQSESPTSSSRGRHAADVWIQTIPPLLWMAVLIMIGTAIWRQAVLPSAKPLWLVADALLVVGLLCRFKLAYVATLFFASLGIIVAQLHGSDEFAWTVLALNGLVAVMVLLCTRWFFPGIPLPNSLPDIPGALRNRTQHGWVIAARWTARILGTLLLAFYGLFIVAEGLPPIAGQPGGVQLNFVALGLMLGGFAVGWKREGTGALLIVSGWTLWHISEGHFGWNLFQLPLLVAALYTVCWWFATGRRTGVLAGTVAALIVVLGLGRLFVPANVFVRGAVTDASTGAVITNASLTLLPPPPSEEEGSRPNARTDQNGVFRLYVGWYTAGKEVAVSAPSYVTLTTNLGPRNSGQRQVNRDFQLSAIGETSRGMATGTPTFGPVTEALLISPQGRNAELLDLDTGLRATSAVFGENDRETHAWIRANKLDALGVVEKGQIAVLCNDMAVIPVASNLWEEALPDQVLTNWGLNQQEPKPITAISPATDKTDTWFFRTREDGHGVLQILGQSDEPPGVNIRYKLTRTGSAKSQVPRIEMKNVPLRDAIRALAKQAKLNVVFDPQLESDGSGPNGRSVLRTPITLEWQNVTAPAALNTLLNNYELTLTQDSQTGVARISMASAEARDVEALSPPPVVVSTRPQSGATRVDPSLTELRVTFSKPMQDGNWSWVQLDNETFPEMTGEPRYLEDKRTCVLPVRLEPGRVYATWINVDEFNDFQDRYGRPAVPYLLVFETRKGAP